MYPLPDRSRRRPWGRSLLRGRAGSDRQTVARRSGQQSGPLL